MTATEHFVTVTGGNSHDDSHAAAMNLSMTSSPDATTGSGTTDEGGSRQSGVSSKEKSTPPSFIKRPASFGNIAGNCYNSQFTLNLHFTALSAAVMSCFTT